jgi:hypothetical protein
MNGREQGELGVTITAEDRVTAALEHVARSLSDAGIVTSFANAMVKLTETMRTWNRKMSEDLRIFSRSVRPHRTGHRHRGTRAWRLRYAMASDAPLGQRTAAKLRERPAP